MLDDGAGPDGPVAIRCPKAAARRSAPDEVGSGLSARRVLQGRGEVCILAVGKMVEAAQEAANLLEDDDAFATVWDVRLVPPSRPGPCSPTPPATSLVVTVEDGIRVGGAGTLHGRRHRRAARGPPPAAPVMILGTPPKYIPQGRPAAIHAQLGLDGPGIAADDAQGAPRRLRPPERSAATTDARPGPADWPPD